MGWVREKLELYARNLKRLAGEDVVDEVLRGSENFNDETSPEELANWTKCSLEKLVEQVDDKTVKNIMVHNACRLIEENWLGDTVGKLKEAKEIYEKNKDIDEVITFMKNDKSIFPDYDRKNFVLTSTKKPRDRESYEKAKTKYEKQKSYCYCPFVRTTKDKIPRSYCYCGAGFNKFIWEEIVGEGVVVELIKSVLDGDDCCTFEIYLPERCFLD
jgi:predicted hydrocarbon binding protein